MNHFLQRVNQFLQTAGGTASNQDLASRTGKQQFSLEELHVLYDVLDRNPIVSESNRSLVVETIRRAAEFLLWGDQNEPRVFEFFMENNVLAYLNK